MFDRTPIHLVAGLALAAVLAITSPALAQSPQTAPAPAPAGEPGQWTVTPFVGFAFSGDLDGGTGALGVAGGYIWSDRIAFEGEGGGVERTLTDSVAFRGDLRYFFGADLVPDFWRLSAGLSFGFGGR